MSTPRLPLYRILLFCFRAPLHAGVRHGLDFGSSLLSCSLNSIIDIKRKIPFEIVDPPTCPSVCKDRAVFNLRSIESPRLQSDALTGPGSAYNGCLFVLERKCQSSIET